MESKIETLRLRCRRVVGFYLFFVLMLGSTCASAGTGLESAITISLLCCAAIATLPVIFLNIGLHHAIKLVSPNSSSAGSAQALFSSIVCTPFEAALVLPAINIVITRKILNKFSLEYPGPSRIE